MVYENNLFVLSTVCWKAWWLRSADLKKSYIYLQGYIAKEEVAFMFILNIFHLSALHLLGKIGCTLV